MSRKQVLRKVKVLAGVLVIFLVACATSRSNGETADHGLSMKSTVKFDDSKIWLVLSIRNSSKHGAWINGKFSWSTRSCKPPSWEITLNLLDSRDRSLGSNCMDSRAPIRDEDYRLLKPGDEYTEKIELGSCFTFEAGEEIEVRATYRDENETPPKPPLGATHWKGQIGAMPAKFLVPADHKP